ncbi:mechanosensitive ion channel domain-containing protein [Ponticoccus litoralis]|uniref:Mechanosensitive ion channel domain-containing protein n=1 Tax=Ponticoccus litoralis TaxID=422297 RepID=A0AAW9SQL5_9RHOB
MTIFRFWLLTLVALVTLALGSLSPSGALAQDAEATPPPPSSLDLLLDVIEDDQSRAALIEELRAAQQTAEKPVGDGVVDALAGEQAPPPEALSFSRRIALITQEVAESSAARLAALWAQLNTIPAVFDGFSGNEAGVLVEALQQLALIIVVTVAVYLVLRRMGKALYRRMGASAAESGVVRTVMLFLASGLIDALIVVVAWATGYLIATLFLGNFGEIGIRQTLYLNAFLLVEMAKVVMRMALSPSARDLRPLPVSDEAAAYLASRLNWIISLVGYGQLLVVPILNANVSLAAGRALSALVALVVVAIAIWMVLRNRRPVAEWLQRGAQPVHHHAAEQHLAQTGTPATVTEDGIVVEEGAVLTERAVAADGSVLAEGPMPAERRLSTAEAPETEDTPEEFPMAEPEADAELDQRRGGALGFLMRHWHWPVLLYLVVMLMLVLVQPADAAFRSLMNSGQVLVVILLGITLSGILTRAMVRGVQLPEAVNARLPLLERRLNTFVPKALFVLRALIFVGVVAIALNAINLIDLRAWMASQIGLRLTGTIFSVGAVLLVAFIIWVAMTSWVDYRLNPEFGTVATAREKTLLTLARNAFTIALFVITLMFVLSEIGLDIAPLLASAGVLGLAIGFGAQKLVQDIITGIFIQFENAMNVGDVVTAGSTTGVVEKLTIRSVSLRDVSGAYHLIPFSSVDMVSNFMRDFGYFVCDMGVAYRENIADVKQAMHDAFDMLRADPEQAAKIMDELEWFGVNAFGDSAVVVRARIKCEPGTQWGVGRAYNGYLKQVFDERNIEIPFPHQTIFLGESKQGATQPFHVRTAPEES